ncbi:MAG TPA: ATP-dependent metallopeptidase FtsH/Yme1/Tma family protein, partial [Caulobacteraceae bacterium]|nr:ATP-dependent metallopeptidase FtsH/Yme1/Tma family protein [Caulobacteraceae bacterium]
MNLRNLAIWGVIVAVMIGVYSMMTQGSRGGTPGEITYSQLLQRIDNGEIRSATIRGPVVEVRGRDDKTYTAVTPENQDDLVKRLEARGADISVKPTGGFTLLGFLLNALPILLLIGVWIFFMRQMQGGARGAMGFGKSKARL